MASTPLVSIITPVHNGAKFITQCVESVLAQTYENWEYIIVENFSEDDTAEIVESYASREPRIKLFKTAELLPVMKNWNYALSKMSLQSKYCKIIHADDCFYPGCVEAMVQVAEKHPSVGMVGAYALWGKKVMCDRIETGKTVFSGREIARLTLQEKMYPFLSPSVLMLRSDLMRTEKHYYDESMLHADVDSCYKVLAESDFGFVDQVLVDVGKHEASATSVELKPLNKIIWQNFDLFIKHGKTFLSDDEYQAEFEKRKTGYYRFLGKNVFTGNKELMAYHKRGLKALGIPFNRFRLLFCWIALKIRGVSYKLERMCRRISVTSQ